MNDCLIKVTYMSFIDPSFQGLQIFPQEDLITLILRLKSLKTNLYMNLVLHSLSKSYLNLISWGKIFTNVYFLFSADPYPKAISF